MHPERPLGSDCFCLGGVEVLEVLTLRARSKYRIMKCIPRTIIRIPTTETIESQSQSARHGFRDVARGAAMIDRVPTDHINRRIPDTPHSFWYSPYIGPGDQIVRALCLCGLLDS